MKKNDVFSFTAPNGVEVTCVVLGSLECSNSGDRIYGETGILNLCYAQNRIFTIWEEDSGKWPVKILADYAILPEQDKLLEEYQHQLDMADDYASRE